MERVIIILFILLLILTIGYGLKAFNDVSEPFVLTQIRNTKTKKGTGVFSETVNKETGEGGYYYCRNEHDPYDSRMGNVPTCKQLRSDMIQRFRDEGIIPEYPSTTECPGGDTEEIVGDIANLRIILNRCAPRNRHAVCFPLLDCDYFVNPKTRRLYCPVGMTHITDSKGNHSGCYSYGNSDPTLAQHFSDETVNPLQSIQTVGDGFRMYPPQNIISQRLQKDNVTEYTKALDEKKHIILNMVYSYKDIMEKYNSSTYIKETVNQFMEGLMNSYLLYQPIGGGQMRVAYYREPGVYVPRLNELSTSYSNIIYDITDVELIPDTLTSKSMPILKPLSQYLNKMPRTGGGGTGQGHNARPRWNDYSRDGNNPRCDA